MTLTFVCEKDPPLARHYEREFKEDFERLLAEPGIDVRARLEGFKVRMLVEAKRQEHYDFVVDERSGRRFPIQERGVKKLLIPTLTVTP